MKMNYEALKEQILYLKLKQADEEFQLKQEVKSSLEKLKPAALLKKTVQSMVSGPELKDGILTTVMSMAAGYLSKKISVGSSTNPIKNILGTLLQIGVTSLVAKNSDQIKQTASAIYGSIREKVETKIEGA